MFVQRYLVISNANKKWRRSGGRLTGPKYTWGKIKALACPFRGHAIWAKMTSPGGKLTTTLACHPSKRVRKVEELTYLFTNIALHKANFLSVFLS